MTAFAEHSTIARSTTGTRHLLAALLCAVLGFATYACSLRGTYVLDDHEVVQGDPRVTTGMWKDLWTRGYRVGGCDKLYRPLVSSSYATEWWLHGDRPWAFHAVNLLLHAGVTAVFTLLALCVLGERPGAIAGLLFAVLPIHTEVVVNIVGRAECMCALPILLGLYLFLTRPLTAGVIMALALCFLVAALSKEQGILFPLFLLAAAPLRWKQGLPAASPNRRRLFVALFLWLPAGYLMFREWMVPMWWDRSVLYWDVNPILRAHGADRVLLPIVLIGHYLQLSLVPVKLSYDYSGLVIGWRVSPKDPYLYLGAVSVALVLGAGVWSVIKRRWAVFLGVCGLALSYALVSNTAVLIATNMGERLFYLPSAFLLLLLAGPIAMLPRRTVVGVLTVSVAILGARSVDYAVRWNDDMSFVVWSLRNQPLGAGCNGFACVEYGVHGDWESALRVAKQFRSLMPDSVNANSMCIGAEMNLGRYTDVKRSVELAESKLAPQDTLQMKWAWTAADEKLRQAAEDHLRQQPASQPETRP